MGRGLLDAIFALKLVEVLLGSLFGGRSIQTILHYMLSDRAGMLRRILDLLFRAPVCLISFLVNVLELPLLKKFVTFAAVQLLKVA